MSPTSNRYSLAGVRAATTAPQEAFIAKARQVLEADGRGLAAYLVGGFAVGESEAFSDVDLQVLVADDAAAELSGSWQELVHRITPTIIAAAEDAGLTRDPDLGEPIVSDQDTTRFTFVSDGRTHRVGAYALDLHDLVGLSSGQLGLSPEQEDNRRRLVGLQQRLDDLTTATTDLYRASAVSVLVATPGQGGGPPIPAGGEAAWPLGDLARGGVAQLGERCLGFSGADAERVLATADGASTTTQWRSGGTTWSLAFRPELPGDTPCQRR